MDIRQILAQLDIPFESYQTWELAEENRRKAAAAAAAKQEWLFEMEQAAACLDYETETPKAG